MIQVGKRHKEGVWLKYKKAVISSEGRSFSHMKTLCMHS